MRLASTVGFALAGCAALSAWRRTSSDAFVGTPAPRLQQRTGLVGREQASWQALDALSRSRSSSAPRVRLAAEEEAKEVTELNKLDRVTVTE